MKIYVIGKGITAKAVKKKLKKIKGFSVSNKKNADIAVISHGIPLKEIKPIKIPIISEIEFAYRLMGRSGSKYRPQIIAVTGTNGKTTVTTLLAEILKSPAAGNIGNPLISYVDSNNKSKYIVVEVSSYMLESSYDFKPYISVILNITPDHLKRHKTMKKYIEEKSKIFRNQDDKNYLVYNGNDFIVKKIAKESRCCNVPFKYSKKIEKKYTKIKIPGKHNIENALAAYHAAKICKVKEKYIMNTINNFRGVEHRIEKVSVVNGITYINDSKATNPDSTVVALKAMQKKVMLILGGEDKGVDLKEMINWIKKKAKKVILLGEAKRRFKKELLKYKYNNIKEVNNMDEAVKCSQDIGKFGDIVLLSPACASFDQYNNFEERGRHFKKLVNLWKKK